MRRRGLLALATLVLAVVVLAAPAGAQEPVSGTTEDTGVPTRDIIPEPNSGEAPADAGDRGGALQIAVLVAVLGGVGLVVTLAVRESRRNRERASAGR